MMAADIWKYIYLYVFGALQPLKRFSAELRFQLIPSLWIFMRKLEQFVYFFYILLNIVPTRVRTQDLLPMVVHPTNYSANVALLQMV